MSITYTEEFNVKKATAEVTVDGTEYAIGYTIQSDKDGVLTQVNANMADNGASPIGYGHYSDGVVSVRFTAGRGTGFAAQAALIERFTADMKTIIG